MKLDIELCKGISEKPALVFIHGLGMDKDIWVNPSRSKILGGRFSLKILLAKKPKNKELKAAYESELKLSSRISIGRLPGRMQTLFKDLKQKGYTVVTWSQRIPYGPVDSVVSELGDIIKVTRKMTKEGIILIGHSRGGLAGRKYLMIEKDSSIRGLITLSSPHTGSSIANMMKYIFPLLSIITPFIPERDKGTTLFALKRIGEFLRSKALREILPGSAFIKSLKDEPLAWVHYISAGGTNPTLFRLYRWRVLRKWENGSYRRILTPSEIISFPDILQKIIPQKFYPEEIKKGKGDGMVSAASSKIPWSHEHYNFDLNHAEILFDKRVRNVLVNVIENI